MARRTTFAALALAAILTAPPAEAQGLSTDRLVQLCSDPASDLWRDIGQWLCPSYIRGLIDGARLQAIHSAGDRIVARGAQAGR